MGDDSYRVHGRVRHRLCPGGSFHQLSTFDRSGDTGLGTGFPVAPAGGRRGFAIAMHGFGSNMGNVLGPLLAGALLTILLWRHVLFIYAAPSLILAGLVWGSLRDVGKEDAPEERTPLWAQLGLGLRLLRNPVIIGLILTSTFRGIALNALFHWTPFYLTDIETGFGMGHFRAGFTSPYWRAWESSRRRCRACCQTNSAGKRCYCRD